MSRSSLAVPKSRPEAAFSNVFRADRRPERVYRAISRPKRGFWSVQREPRDTESEYIGVKRASGEPKREPQGANMRRQETKNELKETLERGNRQSVRRLERNRES